MPCRNLESFSRDHIGTTLTRLSADTMLLQQYTQKLWTHYFGRNDSHVHHKWTRTICISSQRSRYTCDRLISLMLSTKLVTVSNIGASEEIQSHPIAEAPVFWTETLTHPPTHFRCLLPYQMWIQNKCWQLRQSFTSIGRHKYCQQFSYSLSSRV